MFQITNELAALICFTIILSRMVTRWAPVIGFHKVVVDESTRRNYSMVLRTTIYLLWMPILQWDKILKSGERPPNSDEDAERF
jgi:hypothetical protein